MPSEDDAVSFFFVPADKLRDERFKAEPMQILRDKGILSGPQPYDVASACNTRDTLVISHRWEDRANPDPSDQQRRAIREYLLLYPEIRWVWYDYMCLPQKIGPVERSNTDNAVFKRGLDNSNLLYATCRVLVLANGTYFSRFFTLLEFWLATHHADPKEGIRECKEHEERCDVIILDDAGPALTAEDVGKYIEIVGDELTIYESELSTGRTRKLARAWPGETGELKGKVEEVKEVEPGTMKSTFKVDSAIYDWNTPAASNHTERWIIDGELSHFSKMNIDSIYQHLRSKNVKVTNCKDKIEYVEKLIDNEGHDVIGRRIKKLCDQKSSEDVPPAEEDEAEEATEVAATAAPAFSSVDVIHQMADNNTKDFKHDLLRSGAYASIARGIIVNSECAHSPADLVKMRGKTSKLDDADAELKALEKQKARIEVQERIETFELNQLVELVNDADVSRDSKEKLQQRELDMKEKLGMTKTDKETAEKELEAAVEKLKRVTEKWWDESEDSAKAVDTLLEPRTEVEQQSSRGNLMRMMKRGSLRTKFIRAARHKAASLMAAEEEEVKELKNEEIRHVQELYNAEHTQLNDYSALRKSDPKGKDSANNAKLKAVKDAFEKVHEKVRKELEHLHQFEAAHEEHAHQYEKLAHSLEKKGLAAVAKGAIEKKRLEQVNKHMTYQKALNDYNECSTKYKALDDDCFVLVQNLNTLDEHIQMLVHDSAAAEKLREQKEALEKELKMKQYARDGVKKEAEEARQYFDDLFNKFTKENEQKLKASVETMGHQATDREQTTDESSSQSFERAVLGVIKMNRWGWAHSMLAKLVSHEERLEQESARKATEEKEEEEEAWGAIRGAIRVAIAEVPVAEEGLLVIGRRGPSCAQYKPDAFLRPPKHIPIRSKHIPLPSKHISIVLSEKKPPSLGSSPSRLSTFEVNKEVKGFEGRDAPRFESVPGTTRIGAVSFNMAAPNSKRWETQVIQSSQALPDISAEGGRSPSPPKSPASPPMSPKPPRKAKRHPFDVQDHAYDLQDGRAHPVRTIPPMGWAGELREQRIMRAARMPGWADELREQSPKPLRSSRVNDLREQRMRAVRAPGWAGEFDMSPRASRRASWVSEMRDPSPGAVRTPGWAGELRELRFAVKQGAVEANPEAVKPRPLVVMTRFGKPPVTRMPPVVRAGYVHPLSERPEQRRRRLDQPLGMPVSPTGTASKEALPKVHVDSGNIGYVARSSSPDVEAWDAGSPQFARSPRIFRREASIVAPSHGREIV